MNKQLLTLYKNVGETPLEALNRLREKMPEYKDAVLSYAGRLDPMAEGVLLVLVGEENKEREVHLNYDKEYRVNILLGIETDSYDLLGKVTSISAPDTLKNLINTPEKELEERVKKHLEKYSGRFYQKYPPYSSKPVDGKSLFEHSREGNNTLLMPKKEVIVYKNELITLQKIAMRELREYIHKTINLVQGDFRQQEILKTWDEYVNNPDYSNLELWLLEIEISCSSGTYMRSIAHDLGKDMAIGGLAFSIIRTRVGEYIIDESLRI